MPAAWRTRLIEWRPTQRMNPELKTRKHNATDPAEREAIDIELSGADGRSGAERELRVVIAETLDEVLPEAFATVREAARRLLGTVAQVTGREMPWEMVHYDVQLMGGVQLHFGPSRNWPPAKQDPRRDASALLKRWRGGAATSLPSTRTSPAATRSGGPSLQLTRHDRRLYRRHRAWSPQRREAYLADITYGTNNEFGFDYLRDNMVTSLEQRVQRPLVCDRRRGGLGVIDEARTPLIISGAVGNDNDGAYFEHKRRVSRMVARQTRWSTPLSARPSAISRRTTPRVRRSSSTKPAGHPKNQRLMQVLQEPQYKMLVQRWSSSTSPTAVAASKQQFSGTRPTCCTCSTKRPFGAPHRRRGRVHVANDHEAFVLRTCRRKCSHRQGSRADRRRTDRDEAPAGDATSRLKAERLNIVHQLLRAHSLYDRDVNTCPGR